MATDSERNKAFRAERSRQQRRLAAIQKESLAPVVALLAEARDRIAARLAAGPSDFDALRLPMLQEQVRQALAALEAQATPVLTAGAANAWRAGIDLADRPIEAGLGLDRPVFRVSALVPQIDSAQLDASRTFLTSKIRDISTDMAARINTRLGLAVLGEQGVGEATEEIGRILTTGGRARASTLVRTELGRVYSVANQTRLEQAAPVLPGVKKQWRRSGRIHSRQNHDLTDGQIRGVDQSFDVGAGVTLRYPRDPLGPAREVINCGCVQLPYMESWDVIEPGRKAFTDEEIRLNPRKRDLEDALAS